MCKETAPILRIIFLFFFQSVLPATIGSDTAVQEFTTQQLLQGGDRVATFAWLKAGLALQGLNTTSTFDSVFPISGSVALNSGNLLLNTDLIFNNNASFFTLGNIIGNSHWVDFSSSVTTIAYLNAGGVNENSFARQITLSMGTQVVVTSWSFDSQFLAVGLASNGIGGSGNELYLFTYDGTTLTQLAAISLGNHAIDIDWHPSQYMFALGCATSPQVRIYSINPSAPNLSNVISTFALSNGTFWTNAVAYHPSGNYLAAGNNDTTEQIILFPMNTNGTMNTAGRVTVPFGNSVTVNTEALSWSTPGDFLAVGCMSSGGTFNELRVYQLATSPSLALTLDSSKLLGEVGSVDWAPTSTYILFAGLVTTPALVTYAHNTGSLTQIAFLPEPTLVRCVSTDPSSNDVTVAMNFNASGPEMVIYDYDLSGTGVFTTVFSDNSSGSSEMDALQWSPNGQYVAYGDISGVLYIANRLVPAFLTNCFTFSNVYLSMNNDLYIQNSCIQFAGYCAIYGNGNTLTILPTSTLSVGTNSQLLLSNINVVGLSGQNFNPVDNTGSFIFENVIWNLLNNYTFSQGSFSIEGLFDIIGNGNTFIYTTTITSTVSSASILMLDYGVTFSYAPIVSSNSLIQFVDATAILKLANASLFASSVGLSLTKGTCMIDGNSSMISAGSVSAQGISFGDGLKSINNMQLNILPAAVLNVSTGFVTNNNI